LSNSGVKVSQIKRFEELGELPKGISFFDKLLGHEVKEALDAGGEVYVSSSESGQENGLFIYDEYEATGTIFTKSKAVFDHFYKVKPSSYIFSELEVLELPKEPWNIWQLDVDRAPLNHRFRHHVSIDDNVEELERFMAATQPETNRKWVSVALKNGDKCFVVRFGERIVGIAWLEIVDGLARSHGLYVEPQFRRMGIMRDNLEARLIYLKARGVHTLVNEISESNIASSSHAAKAGEKIVGKIFLYESPERQLSQSTSSSS
jgi:ribosomal protein S18 acetylase RimI-like enzyme